MKFLRENGLSLTLFLLFVVLEAALSMVGLHEYNDELRQHGMPEVDYLHYVASDDFLEVTMENWESEFLQMFAFVLLTTFLYQKGSSESKSPDRDEDVDREPDAHRKGAPWPVRRGGLALRLYSNSLSLALLALFILSLTLHAVGGVGLYNEEARQHGEPTISLVQFLGTAQFWYESLQNWQSEFFSIAVLVVLTIFLRQKGSSQSRAVDAPTGETGD